MTALSFLLGLLCGVLLLAGLLAYDRRRTARSAPVRYVSPLPRSIVIAPAWRRKKWS